MTLIKLKPTTPGQRFTVKVSKKHLHKGAPLRSLTEGKTQNAGRNNSGRITVRHRGGGHKKLLRLIDYKRYDKDGVPAKVERLEYDPNRSAHLALLCYADGERRYIISTANMAVDQEVMAGDAAPIREGNSLSLTRIPVGTIIHNVELKPRKGAQLARSAGASVQFVARELGMATLRLRSGEMRKVSAECRATIGSVSNAEHNLMKLGKAGAKRWKGIRPTVRGVAMNPVDHPHGGGEGKTSGGRHPVSPTGVLAKGYRTRTNKRSDIFIVKRRYKK